MAGVFELVLTDDPNWERLIRDSDWRVQGAHSGDATAASCAGLVISEVGVVLLATQTSRQNVTLHLLKQPLPTTHCGTLSQMRYPSAGRTKPKMIIDRRRFLQVGSSSAAISLIPSTFAETTQRQPIIDVHLHAYPADAPIPEAKNPATGKTVHLKDGAAHRAACFAEMKRLNIVKAIVSGGDGDRLAAATAWHDADPGRIIPGAGIRGSEDTPLPDLNVLRSDFKEGRMRVLGEVTTQYAGLTLDDPKYAAYLALAEELDIPVALHTGTMPPGMSFDPCCRTARARLGNPGLVEDALNRYPKLRLNLMHAGWPYLDDTLSILFHYPRGERGSGRDRLAAATRGVSPLSAGADACGVRQATNVRHRPDVLA